MTQSGRTFYERTMPELVRQLSDLNKNLKILNDKPEPILAVVEKPSYTPHPVEDVHIAVGPEEIDQILADAEGSDVRRKLGIARGKLEDIIEFLKNNDEYSYTIKFRNNMMREISAVIVETADSFP
jgi:hypothetical protein